jgi:hypothetical protein
MSVRVALTGRIFVKFGIGDFRENLSRETPDLVKMGQKYRALYM